MIPSMRIYLFRSVQIEHANRTDDVQLPPSVQALLAFLVLNCHRPYAREVLASLFWEESDDERARGCLSTALWRLRRALEPEGVARGSFVFTSANGDIGFNGDGDYWVDVEEFRQVAQRARSWSIESMRQCDADQLQKAIDLYTGDLLKRFYFDWAIRERERMRSLYLYSLAVIMRYHMRHGEFDLGLNCGDVIRWLDPFREDIHREIIRHHVQARRFGDAVRQYERLRQFLATELGITPMEETQALVANIATVRHGSPLVPGIPVDPPAMDDQLVVLHLRTALSEIERARELLMNAFHRLVMNANTPQSIHSSQPTRGRKRSA